MSPPLGSVEWSQGASPDAMTEAFGQEALTIAILAILLDDPELRARAAAVLQQASDTANPDAPTR